MILLVKEMKNLLKVLSIHLLTLLSYDDIIMDLDNNIEQLFNNLTIEENKDKKMMKLEK